MRAGTAKKKERPTGGPTLHIQQRKGMGPRHVLPAGTVFSMQKKKINEKDV